MSLRRRFDRLSVTRPERCEIHLWLYDTDSDTATSPNGERMTHAEADQQSAQADLVIDLRVKRET